MKKYRNEWKYCCQGAQISALKQRLSAVLESDSYADEDGTYEIHSLYFDDFNNSCVKDVDSGVSKRCKYRIRFYGDNPDIIHLERKEKLYERCHKKSCVLTKDEYDKLIAGEASTLYWASDNKLLRQFCLEIMSRAFRPCVIIDYNRTAFVEPISNIRITIDENISASDEVAHFLDGNYLRIPLQDINYYVLEVKFDYILPSYIKKIIEDSFLQQTSFSKYNMGRKKLNNLGRYM